MESERQCNYQPGPNRFAMFAGVIMPAISITVEASTHICANFFFDPIPTIWHLMLVVFVPLAQFHVWFTIRRLAADRIALAGVLNSVVISISLFYSIVYLPLIPVGIGALVFGLGLLPLAPYLSLVAALIMRRQLKEIAATAPHQSFGLEIRGLLAGLTFVTVAIGVMEFPGTLTTIGMQMATSSSPQTQRDGIRFLRAYGNRQALLRSCFGQTYWATNLVGSAFSIKNPITTAEARKIYYRVTGDAIDQITQMDHIGTTLRPRNRFSFDYDEGGMLVGNGKLAGLSLAMSNLDGNVDADGGVGYMEWTLDFRNDTDVQREARAEVQLPPGSVVSRLTLWVNGEEREAAFAGRRHVREAYLNVAFRQRRDPVLVTTSGRDRVLIQCFPVPPYQGEMKIRFGITIPLVLEDYMRAKLILPSLLSSNFDVSQDAPHVVLVKGKTLMWSNNSNLITRHPDDVFSVGGVVKDEFLAEQPLSITISRSGTRAMWSEDPFNPGFAVTQSVNELTPTHFKRLVVVVDNSAVMQKYIPEIQGAIASLPADLDVKLLLADNNNPSPGDIALPDLYGQDRQSIQRTLSAASFAGGADNAPALLEAWNLASQTPGNNAIVWIHSPQRMLLTPVNELAQKWEQREDGPRLYSVQTNRGMDEIEKKLEDIEAVTPIVRAGPLQIDLENLFARVTGRVKTLNYVRSSRKLDNHTPLRAAVHTSDHLARLWANDEVARILAPNDVSLNSEAIMLASRYQLVTPVTGAVVLETAEQYQAEGLKPVDAGTVPTIPEPEMVVLLIVAAAFMIRIMYLKASRPGRGRCCI